LASSPFKSSSIGILAQSELSQTLLQLSGVIGLLVPFASMVHVLRVELLLSKIALAPLPTTIVVAVAVVLTLTEASASEL
jgi:hypothetical protein